MRFLKWIILLAVAAYLAVTAFVFFTQRSFQYFPPDVYVTPQAAGVDMKEINYSMRPGVGAGINTVPDLTFWYAAPASDTAPVIMFFHGNGSAVYSNSHIFSDLIDVKRYCYSYLNVSSLSGNANLIEKKSNLYIIFSRHI